MTTVATLTPDREIISEMLTRKLETLFTEEGFTEIKLDRTQRTFTLTATKEAISAVVHLVIGRREKGHPATAMALAPLVTPKREPIIVPTLPIERAPR